MEFDYSDELSPAAMIVPISVAAVARSAAGSTRALLDTGADISAIPDDLRRELALRPTGYARCSGALDVEPQTLPTYFVRFEIYSVRSVEVEVVSMPEEHVLLGRDVLNGLVLTADGPGRRFQLAAGEEGAPQ